MNRTKKLLSTCFILSIFLASAVASYSQSDVRPMVEPSYELSLQLVIGSNDAAQRGELPSNLAAISRQLKSTFAFSNYRLAGTFLGRISNTGSFEYKSTSNIFGQESEPKAQPVFLDWTVGSFRTGPTVKGPQGFQAQNFRFGARVPVTVSSFKDEAGKTGPVIQYESIGLSLGRIGLPENSATLIGTLNLPGANGTIFLVMTVKSADI